MQLAHLWRLRKKAIKTLAPVINRYQPTQTAKIVKPQPYPYRICLHSSRLSKGCMRKTLKGMLFSEISSFVM